MRYECIRELGRGGFGVVWLAKDKKTNKLVAIKFLKELSQDARQRFEREARTLLQLSQQDFVVELLDGDLGAQQPYLVLEYCAGGSLRSWVAARRPWTHGALAILGAARALDAIEKNGGFHRDIKPENLLVGLARNRETHVVKISDFGLARVPTTSAPWVTRTACGTPGYIAPELYAPGAVFSAKADVWSLGVVALEILTGGREVSRLDHIQAPPDLVRLVKSMLKQEPQWRLNAGSVAIFALDILKKNAREALSDKNILAPKPSGPDWGAIASAALIGIGILAALGK